VSLNIHCRSDCQSASRQKIDILRNSYKITVAMMSMATDTKGSAKLLKADIGVYTIPQHDLWIAEAEPSLENVTKGDSLKPGQVTVAIRSAGICG
jgi:hypothetical protein